VLDRWWSPRCDAAGWTAGAAALLALIVGLALGRNTAQSGNAGLTDVVRVALTFGDSTKLRAIDNIRLAISPGGQRVAFVGD
jgi:hypothetical protein